MPIIDPEQRRIYQRAWLKKRRAGMTDRRRKHDWKAVQAQYDSGVSARRCMELNGMARGTWQKAVERGELISRGQCLSPIESLKARGSVKRRLIKSGVLQNVCAICKVTEWMGKALIMVLDHENGVNDDNAPANLRMLCPNCNSQTDTFAGRNVKRRKMLADSQAV
jgi:hypothetical protein